MVSRADDLHLRALLIERLGEEATDKLMDRLPATPVHEFATKADIAALRGEMLDEFGKLRQELGGLRGEFGRLEAQFADLRTEIADRMRVQTWTMTGVFATAMGVAVAAAGLG